MEDPNESTPEEFAEYVGRAIMAWQGVEMRCSSLFARLLEAGNGPGASAAFYSIKGFAPRLEMLRIAARFRFPSQEQEAERDEFKVLARRLEECVNLRNRLAHSEVDEVMTESGWKFSLHPPIFDWSKVDFTNVEKWVKTMKDKKLDFTAVKGAAGKFVQLCDDLLAFERKLVEKHRKKQAPIQRPPPNDEHGSGH